MEKALLRCAQSSLEQLATKQGSGLAATATTDSGRTNTPDLHRTPKQSATESSRNPAGKQVNCKSSSLFPQWTWKMGGERQGVSFLKTTQSYYQLDELSNICMSVNRTIVHQCTVCEHDRNNYVRQAGRRWDPLQIALQRRMFFFHPVNVPPNVVNPAFYQQVNRG